MNRHTARNEFRAWENSLEYMYKVLNDNEIPSDAGIAIEYNIPQTSKRIDFLISGYDASERGNVVIIELKQWDKIDSIKGKDALVETYTGNAVRQVVHPSYQAWSYAMLITDYNQSVQERNMLLWPCAYLHNYRRKENDPLDEEQYETYLEDAPAFTRGQVDKLRAFIKKSVVKGDNKEFLYAIEHGKIKPSKSLQDAIANMLKGNPEFVMLDEQKVVYEEILNASRQSMQDNKKRVLIVEGGPGTGKTVVAVNLLAQLTNEDQFCQYVSKNSAPRNVYQKKLKGEIRKSSIDNMFKGSGIYTDAAEGIVDTILIDEAHRLNEKSGMFQNMGENQIKEIIHAARCSVFFIDESQRVTMNDIGSVAEIEKWREDKIHEELKKLRYLDRHDEINRSLKRDLKTRDTIEKTIFENIAPALISWDIFKYYLTTSVSNRKLTTGPFPYIRVELDRQQRKVFAQRFSNVIDILNQFSDIKILDVDQKDLILYEKFKFEKEMKNSNIKVNHPALGAAHLHLNSGIDLQSISNTFNVNESKIKKEIKNIENIKNPKTVKSKKFLDLIKK